MPADIFLNSIDLDYTNQIQNFRIHNVSTAQRSLLGATLNTTHDGLTVYDTDLNRIFTWNGIGWDNPPTAGVTSFNGRIGDVIPTQGDYSVTLLSDFPNQTGNSTKFLQTDGTKLVWAPIPVGYTDQQAQDAVGHILSGEFAYNNIAHTIGVNHIDWSKIINTPPFVLNEQDPTVPPWVKTIQQGSVTDQYLGWDGVRWAARQVSYLELSHLPILATQYTDEMAEDAVAAMILNGAHTGVNVVYNDSQNTLDISVAQLQGFWKLGGNNFGVLSILGTTDNNPVALVSNGSEVARMLTTGEFAIGRTTSVGSTYKLQIGGNFHLTGNALVQSISGSGTSFVYVDPNGTLQRGADATTSDSVLIDSFIVGDAVNFPTSLPDLSTQYTITNVTVSDFNQLLVFVDGSKIFPNRSDRFSYIYNSATQIIAFNSPLKAGQSFEAYKIKNQLLPGAPPPTTIIAPTFDQLMTFGTSTQQSGYGVTVQVAALSPTTKFEYSHISPTTGFPENMDISVGGNPAVSVSFTSDYLGTSFRYTHSNGVQYVRTFTSGQILL